MEWLIEAINHLEICMKIQFDHKLTLWYSTDFSKMLEQIENWTDKKKYNDKWKVKHNILY